MSEELIAQKDYSVCNEILSPVSDNESTLWQQPGRNLSVESESEKALIERLGRQRPEKFPTLWKEIGFCFSVVMSQLLIEYFSSGFLVLIRTVAIDLDLSSTPDTWPASAFALTVACFLLPFGRVADMYGGFPVYVAGTIWLGVWSAIAAVSKNALMLDICRALQGLGPAAFLPASLTLLGSIYRPGPRKNIVFSIYGAMAPIGYWIGFLFAGISGTFITWRWYFYFGTFLSLLSAFIAYLTIPSDIQERRRMGIKMDWWGSITIIVGLILFVFAITEVSNAPNLWATKYIIVSLVLGVVFLIAAIYVEGWVAETPLLPADIFHSKSMKPLNVALLFAYGSTGVYLLYVTYYMEIVMGATPMQVAAWYTPLVLGGVLISTVGGFVLHIIPNTILIIFASICGVIAPLLFVLAPPGANYWAWVLPSLICGTLAIDIIFNTANIFITTSLPTRRQGIAGALVNVLVQLGMAVCLGWADVVAAATAEQGLTKSIKAALLFEVSCSAMACVLLVGFVRIDRAKSDLTADEKEARARMELESRRRGSG